MNFYKPIPWWWWRSNEEWQRDIPHAGILQHSHDPLDPVYGNALLETAESCKQRKRGGPTWVTVSLQRGWGRAADGLFGECACSKGGDGLSLWARTVGVIQGLALGRTSPAPVLTGPSMNADSGWRYPAMLHPLHCGLAAPPRLR